MSAINTWARSTRGPSPHPHVLHHASILPAALPLCRCLCSQEVDVGKHNWGNYFLAAYKGVFEHLAARGQAAPGPSGLQIMIHGTVPTGACCARCAAHAALRGGV